MYNAYCFYRIWNGLARTFYWNKTNQTISPKANCFSMIIRHTSIVRTSTDPHEHIKMFRFRVNFIIHALSLHMTIIISCRRDISMVMLKAMTSCHRRIGFSFSNAICMRKDLFQLEVYNKCVCLFFCRCESDWCEWQREKKTQYEAQRW